MSKVDVVNWFLDGAVTDAEIAIKWANLKTSADSRNIEFDLSLKKVKQLLKAKRCAFSNVSFTPIAGQDTSKTIDRVDNDRGYVDDNVVAVCRMMNTLKGSMSIKQLQALHKGVMKFVNKRKLTQQATKKRAKPLGKRTLAVLKKVS